MKVQSFSSLLLATVFALFVVPASLGQSAQTSPPETPKSRPESFEWDHQIELFDEAYNDANYVEAERFARKSLEIADQLQLGDGKRATSLSSTAEALRFQKKFAEAEPLYRQALAIRDQVLPAIHPRTAYTLEGLAGSLNALHRPNEAEPYYLRAIAIWDRMDEDNYSSCHHGKVLDGLGRIYIQAGSYEKAEPLYQRALDIWTKGKEHCTVIRVVMDDLAALYWAQGKLQRCEQMYEQTIPLLQKGLGDERPELVAQERAKLARVYMAENKPGEAVALLEQVVPVLQQSGPSQRELLLESLRNEAMLLGELHRDSDVPKVQGQIDAILGIKAQSVEPAVQWRGLWDLALHSTVPEQRLSLLRQALVPAEKLGPGRELAQTLDLLGAESTKHPAEAEAHLKRALSVNQQVFGNNSTQVAETFGHLAFLFATEKKEVDEEACLKQQIAVLEKLSGQQLRLSIAAQNLGFLYWMQKRYAEAEATYLQSLHAAEASPAPNDVMVMSAAQRLGVLYRDWEKYDNAVIYYTRAVELEKASPMPNRLLVVDLETLSDLLRKLNRPEEAQRFDEERKETIDRFAKLLAGSPTK